MESFRHWTAQPHGHGIDGWATLLLPRWQSLPRLSIQIGRVLIAITTSPVILVLVELTKPMPYADGEGGFYIALDGIAQWSHFLYSRGEYSKDGRQR